MIWASGGGRKWRCVATHAGAVEIRVAGCDIEQVGVGSAVGFGTPQEEAAVAAADAPERRIGWLPQRREEDADQPGRHGIWRSPTPAPRFFVAYRASAQHGSVGVVVIKAGVFGTWQLSV